MDDLDPASRGEVLRLIQHAFSLFDADKNGNIDVYEFASVLRFLGQDPSIDEVQEKLNEVDENGNGLVDFNEFIFLMENMASGESETSFHFLEQLIVKARMRSVLEKVPILSGCDDKLIDQLVSRLKPQQFPPETYLMKQGDDGNEMWIISEGSVDILVGPNEMCVATIGKGSFIGEVALLKSAKRNASVRTVDSCSVARLDKVDFDEVMSQFPETRQLIMQVADGRERARDVITKVDIFRDCDSAFLNQLVVKLKPEFYKPQSVIIKEGDTGKEMFILDRGEVEVVAGDYEGSGGVKVLAKLPAGTFFGEIALLKHTRRNATIRCLTDCEVFRLNQSDFEEVLGKFPDYTEKIQAVANEKTLRREQHMMPLHLQCRSGVPAHVDKVLDDGDAEKLINQKDELGWTCIHETANAGHADLIRHLHKRGAEVDTANHEGQTPLLLAASGEKLECVKVLVELGARVGALNDDGETALHFSARNGNSEISELLLANGADPNVPSITGWTPLHYCANLGHTAVLRMLIEKKANVNAHAFDDRTGPLHQATLSDNLDAVKLLIEAGAEVDQPDDEGGTPLQYAANSGSIDACRLLLDNNANPSYQDFNGHSPLHHAAAGGDPELVTLLVERGARVKARGLDGGTPYTFASGSGYQDTADIVGIQESELIWAIRLGEQEQVQELLSTGTADVNEVDPDDHWTPLHEAAVGGSVQMVKLLLDYGADVLASDMHGLTPVHIAAANGNLVPLKALLHTPNGDRCLLMYDNLARNPLHLSLSRYHLEPSHQILSHVVNYAIKDKNGKSAKDYFETNEKAKYPEEGYDFFHPAVGLYLAKDPPSDLYFALLSEDPSKAINEIFANGAENVDMEYKDDKGQSVLHLAVMHGLGDAVKVLLANGMDPNSLDAQGQTALFLAAGYGQVDVCKQLLDAGADKLFRDSQGFVAYDYAVSNNQTECADLLYDTDGNLLQAVLTGDGELVTTLVARPDCNVNIGDPAQDGKPLIQIAAEGGHTDIVQVLLENGADPKLAKLDKGQNLLHLAVSHGNAALVDVLLRAGLFDVNAVDEDGNSALHLAAQLGRGDIVSALIAAGADQTLENGQGKTAHDLATENGHAEAVALLLPSDQKLTQAIMDGDHATVSALLEAGDCDVNIRGAYGNTLLHLAAERNDSDLIYLLLAHGAPIDEVNDVQQTAVHVSALKGHSDALSVLLRKRANIHLADRAGHTALHLAASNGDIDCLELLKMHKANLAALSNAEKTARDLALENGHLKAAQLLQSPDEAVADAIVRGDTETLVKLIAEGKLDQNSRPAGMHPVHFAARRDRGELVRMLIHRGFPLDTTDDSGRTAWHIAALYGASNALSVLAELGADLSGLDNDLNNPLHHGAKNGHMKVTEFLVSKAVPLSDRNSDNKTPYDLARAAGHDELASLIVPPEEAAFAAIEQGDKNTLVSLIQSGKVDPNATDSNGRPLLHLALHRADSEMVNILLSRGADPNAKDAEGNPALHIAMAMQRGELVGVLLAKGANPNSTDPNGNTALHIGADIGFVIGIRRLLKANARRDLKNRNNRIPLDIAIANGHDEAAVLLKHPDDAARDAIMAYDYEEMERLFQDEQITPETVNKNGENLLHLAVEMGDIRMIRLLLQHGVNPNQGDVNGNTPMHAACASSSRDGIVHLFLASGGRTDVRNNAGDTPLHTAARANTSLILEVLLAANAERHAQNNDGYTAYDIAAELGFHDCVDVLTVSHAILMAVMSGDRVAAEQALAEGECDANMMNSRGMPLLHLACEHNDLPMVQLLLAHGAKINSRDTSHRTCAHVLASKGFSKIMKVLMLKGIKVDTSDKKGNTPLHYAAICGSESIAQKLINAKVRLGKLNNDGMLAEHLANENQHYDVGILLARARFLPLDGFTNPLHQALHRFSLVASEQLFLMAHLKKILSNDQINVNKRDGPSQSTALHVAAMVKHPPALSLLLRKRRPNINAKNGNSHTPLHLAAQAGDAESVQLLLYQGADPNASDRNQWTPLHEAAFAGDEECVNHLLDGGAVVYSETSAGLSASQIAERQGHLVLSRKLAMPRASSHKLRLQQAVADHDVDTVLRLLDSGDSPSIIDENGGSLLHMACSSFDPTIPESSARETVIALVDAGTRLDTVDNRGRSPIHLCCVTRDLKAMYFLLKAGANCDLLDNMGNTPLHYVASAGFKDGAIALLSASHHSLQTHNKRGLTPYKLALSKDHTDLANLLERTTRGDGHVPTPNNLKKARSVAYLPTPSPKRRPHRPRSERTPGGTPRGTPKGTPLGKTRGTSRSASARPLRSTEGEHTGRNGWATAPVTPASSRPGTRGSYLPPMV